VDAVQFDRLAKTLGSGTTRRRVLGVLAGGLVVAREGRQATIAAQCAKAGQKPKDTKKECCLGLIEVEGRCQEPSLPTCPVVDAQTNHCMAIPNCGSVSGGVHSCRCLLDIFDQPACTGATSCAPCTSHEDCEAIGGSFGQGAVCVPPGPTCCPAGQNVCMAACPG
jgi:hypothetical protein